MRFLQSLQQYDEELFLWFLQRRSYETLVAVSRLVSCTGDGYWYVLVGWLAYWADAGTGTRLMVTGLAAFAFERPIYFVLKNTLKRGRPQTRFQGLSGHIIPSDEFSFPSGHTSAAFLTAVLCAWFYPTMMPGIFLWAALVGMSRIFLRVHYPADVVAGAGLGVICALTAIAWLGG